MTLFDIGRGLDVMPLEVCLFDTAGRCLVARSPINLIVWNVPKYVGTSRYMPRYLARYPSFDCPLQKYLTSPVRAPK
jgi:hypothetical protein